MQLASVARTLVPQIDHVAVPTGAGALDAALRSGRLPGSRDAALLDRIEHLVATGQPIDATRRTIGTEGMNGFRTAVNLRTVDGSIIDVVEKPVSAQGAQEHFGWLVARELGIDHRVALVARGPDGGARIEHLPDAGGWMSLHAAGVGQERDLERLLAKCIRHESPELDESEVLRTARIERQLLQTYDYLLANSDRNLGNGRVHESPYALKLFDHGHAGAGQHERPDLTIPGLKSALQGSAGRTKLDADVVAYLQQRVTPTALGTAHDAAFGMRSTTTNGGTFARMNGYARSDAFRSGVQARLEHIVGTADTPGAGEFRYGTPGTSLVPPLLAVDQQPMRMGMAQARFGAHGAFGDRMM